MSDAQATTTTDLLFEIKHRFNGNVLFSLTCGSMHLCVEAAVKARIDLSYADLISADLSSADLSSAVLRSADLRSVDLSYADLRSADLRSADVRYTDLRYADLRSAVLSCADLSYADLSYTDLSSADLRCADLRCADLRYAVLSYAVLSCADVRSIKADFLAEVLRLPNELEALRDAITDGRIDGSTYSGDCACLAGTLAKARGIENYDGENIAIGTFAFHASVSSPREKFFAAIKPGDTPEKSSPAKIALEWTNEAIAIRDAIRATAV
jgi:hypothetical protein